MVTAYGMPITGSVRSSHWRLARPMLASLKGVKKKRCRHTLSSVGQSPPDVSVRASDILAYPFDQTRHYARKSSTNTVGHPTASGTGWVSLSTDRARPDACHSLAVTPSALARDTEPPTGRRLAE